MPDAPRSRSFAVLIDADNTSHGSRPGCSRDRPIRRSDGARAYGDFSSARLRSWTEILEKFAIDPYQQFADTLRKNASDIALVIDARDLAHSGRSMASAWSP
jgi:hypothetical protein